MIFIVTGFMRSGTSMMMAALRAGGLPIVEDATRRIRHELTTRQMEVFGFPREHDGCAIKVVFPYLSCLAVHAYRVVVMHRDPAEIRASYRAAFGIELPEDFEATYPARFAEKVAGLCNRKDVESLSVVDFHEVMAEPRMLFELLVDAGWPIDPGSAARAVDPGKVRFRRKELAYGDV